MTLTREQAREHIHNNPEIYLTKAKKSGYICPLCGSGSGENGTGITTKDGIHFTCFAGGCFGKGADIIEIIAKVSGISDGGSWEAFEAAYKIYGIEAGRETAARQPAAQTVQPKETEPQKPPTDYTDYFLQAHKRIHETDYPQRRGLSENIINRFKLGYDPQWISPTAAEEAAKKGYTIPPSPRLIIPISCNGYLARDTRESIPTAAQPYKKMKEGKLSTFNAGILKTAAQPIFITEGEINAMSIIEVGGEAAAIGTTVRAEAFIKEVERDRPQQPLIIAMDNDKNGKGQQAAANIAAGLKKLNIPFIILPGEVLGGHNDVNDAYTANKTAFTEAVKAAIRQAEKAAIGGENIDILFKGESILTAPQPTQETEQREYPTAENPQPDSISEYLERTFIDDIKHFAKYKDKKTGFSNIDKYSGGLYPGLYVIGAISSLGKTTFIHQLGDQLAAAGEHILFFSLEQSRLEMVTKSLSRTMARRSMTTAKSAIQIRKGEINDEVTAAAGEYNETAKRVSIIECHFKENIDDILKYIRDYIAENPGIKPVVIVDYLQIIQPSDPRQEARAKIDYIVSGLKDTQKNNGLVMFVVSSINRANYLLPIDYESFKESGGIEYTADVVWGLQLQVLNDPTFEVDKKIKEKRDKARKAKAAIPRKIELVCLKNRYGASTYNCGFNYYPQFDLFVEDTAYKEGESGEAPESSIKAKASKTDRIK